MSASRLSPTQVALVHQIELHHAGWHDKVNRQLILGAFWLADSDLDLSEITTTLKQQFEVEISTEVIRRQLVDLENEGVLIQAASPKFRLSQESRQSIDAQISSAEALETEVRNLFVALLRDNCEEIDFQECWQRFYADLLFPVVQQAGAAVYDLIVRKGFAERVYADLPVFLNTFPVELHIGLRTVISNFLDPEVGVVREYVLAILNSSFLVRSTSLHSDELAAVSRAMSTHPQFVVYVDTNYLFSILGLHDNPSNDDARSLLGLVQTIAPAVEVTLCASAITVEELQAALTNVELRLADVRLHLNMADAVIALNVPGLISRLAQASKEAGHSVSAEELFSPYRNNPLQALRSHGIEPDLSPISGLKIRQDVVDDIVSTTDHLTLKGRHKSYRQIEHDMVLWHQVFDLRPAVVESPLDARYWIATIDFGFLGFDSFKLRATSHGASVCLHPAALMHLLQFWLPRSQNLDRAILGSLRSLFLVREFDSEAERTTVSILRALSRFDNVQDLDVNTVGSILLNDSLRARLTSNKGIDEQTVLVREALAEELVKSEDRRRAADDAIAALGARIEGEVAARTLAEHRLEHEQVRRAESEADLASRLAAMERDRDQERLASEMMSRRSRFTWIWLVVVPLVLAGIGLIGGMLLREIRAPLLPDKFLPAFLPLMLLSVYCWWLASKAKSDPAVMHSRVMTVLQVAKWLLAPVTLLSMLLWAAAANGAWEWLVYVIPSLAPPTPTP